MSDDERLLRLTELARRVWPDGKYVRELGVYVAPNGQRARVVNHAAGFDLLDVKRHPRSLDALEAALLVLTGDVTIRGVRGAVLVPMLPIDRDAERIVDGLVAQSQTGQRTPLVPAWAEELAVEWEARAARMLREGGAEEVASEVMLCAAKLRERAKETP
jgi:hypothetical protein